MAVAKYQRFGKELSVEGCWIQSALLLDLAAEKALKQEDVDKIANVAAGWMELAARIGGGVDGEEEMELTSQPGYQMGFGPNARTDEGDEDEDIEYDPDEVTYPEPDEQ